ncbi:MAG: amidohydrolase [Pseudomonadales bacterium]|jgi:predicted amidohydrolase YtcJ|nr:amidohydrolase [Gammaproteobacteria bacterium]MBP6052593.1 amidohydrolase [Pseudomonadales bacterium]MBK6582099.1 amidohydrolase [Gammaproteobacteria bacterium]MBK7521627.1 amidohydrolase [Gammaproteobacteria bacterium]MBK8307565.1 amidohydrolase [Gammaproteobacteria bacterium]
MQPSWIATVWAGVFAAAVHASDADLIITHARVLTQDTDNPRAEAVAIADGRLLAVGSLAQVLEFKGDRTLVEDVDGATLLPGIIDTHSHPVIGAAQLDDCSLGDEPLNIAAIAPLVHACMAADGPAGAEEWVVAINLNPAAFEADRVALDGIVAERPLALLGTDEHTAWVNTRGLELTGIDRNTPDPRGGRITRDAHGEPTGHLIDNAQQPLTALLPEDSLASKVEATARVFASMQAVGITAVMDAAVHPAELEVYAELARSKRLVPRVFAALAADVARGSASIAEMSAWREKYRGLPHLTLDTVKIFADGVIEYPTQSAALLEPYLDADGKPGANRGEVYVAPRAFAGFVSAAAAQDFNVHVHAIGDRAVRETLDAFAAARATAAGRGVRFSISHLQLIEPSDWPRFAALDVFASFQLLWAQPNPYSIEAVAPYIGAARMRYMYPARGVHDAGGVVVGGSDWNVSSFNPFEAIDIGHTRRNPEEPQRPPLVPEQALPVEVLLRAYTIDAARMFGIEDETGSLRVGKAADLVLVDRDPLAAGTVVRDTQVLGTMIDGVWVYRKKK